MHRLMVVLIPALSFTALAESAPAPVEGQDVVREVAPVLIQWSEAHAAAHAALADWVRANPDAARQMFWWDRQHPLRAAAFLRWGIEHVNQAPADAIDAFAAAHDGWPAMNLVLKPNRERFGLLVTWARAHPDAVRELLAAPRGFAWLGFHDLQDLWRSTAASPSNPSNP